MNGGRTTRDALEELASYRRSRERIQERWSWFLGQRGNRLQCHPLVGNPTEEATIGILEDLFTGVLDWPLSEFNHEVRHADIVLTDHGIKRLAIEAKRPGLLAGKGAPMERALDQVRGYAMEQKINRVAVSDGMTLYAADLANGRVCCRVFLSLSCSEAPEELWWLTVQGIWRDRPEAYPAETLRRTLKMEKVAVAAPVAPGLLHPKYKLPSHCFAFVGNPLDVHSWKLPYLSSDASIDRKRLPKAIGAILSNYRGAKVDGIPEAAIPDVLKRLGAAAAQCGRLTPDGLHRSAPVYRQLSEALLQLGISFADLTADSGRE